MTQNHVTSLYRNLYSWEYYRLRSSGNVTLVNVKVTVFFNVTPCSLIDTNIYEKSAASNFSIVTWGRRFLRNVVTRVPECLASRSKISCRSISTFFAAIQQSSYELIKMFILEGNVYGKNCSSKICAVLFPISWTQLRFWTIFFRCLPSLLRSTYLQRVIRLSVCLAVYQAVCFHTEAWVKFGLWVRCIWFNSVILQHTPTFK